MEKINKTLRYQEKLEETSLWWWLKLSGYSFIYLLLVGLVGLTLTNLGAYLDTEWLLKVSKILTFPFSWIPNWGLVFIGHWYLSLFAQSAFLHRYASHETYEMSPWKVKAAFILCWLFQGPSYLSMHAYGILHILHHRYTDTEMDVHSPSFDKSIFGMMKRTAKIYLKISSGENNFWVDGRHYVITQELRDKVPRWDAFDKFADGWLSRVLWGIFYAGFYIYIGLANDFSIWMWCIASIMILVHWGMGPIHGVIINWWGHLRGYRNHETKDTSRNIGWILVSFPMNLLMLGEDLHNNHHHKQYNQNFAHRWWEFDVTHTVLWFADLLGVISFKERTPLV